MWNGNVNVERCLHDVEYPILCRIPSNKESWS